MAEKPICTVCPRISAPFYIVTYNISLVTTSWTDGITGWNRIGSVLYKLLGNKDNLSIDRDLLGPLVLIWGPQNYLGLLGLIGTPGTCLEPPGLFDTHGPFWDPRDFFGTPDLHSGSMGFILQPKRGS